MEKKNRKYYIPFSYKNGIPYKILNKVKVDKLYNDGISKQCSKCNSIFLVEEFYKGSNWCKKCRIEYGIEYYQKNKDIINKKRKECQQKDGDNVREKRKEYKQKNVDKIIVDYMEYSKKDKIGEYYVYKLCYPDGTPYYIGKGTSHRLMSRYRNRYCNNVTKSIRKSGEKSYFEIIDSFDNEEDAYVFEIELIKKYGKRVDNTGILTNIANGGEGKTHWKRYVVAKYKNMRSSYISKDVIVVYNLKQFCDENNLWYSTMTNLARYNFKREHQHKGFICCLYEDEKLPVESIKNRYAITVTNRYKKYIKLDNSKMRKATILNLVSLDIPTWCIKRIVSVSRSYISFLRKSNPKYLVNLQKL